MHKSQYDMTCSKNSTDCEMHKMLVGIDCAQEIGIETSVRYGQRVLKV